MRTVFQACIISLLMLLLSASVTWGQTNAGDSVVRELAVDGLSLFNNNLSAMYRVYDANGRARRYMGSVSANLGGALDSPLRSGSNSAGFDLSIGSQRNFRTGKVSWYRGLDYRAGYSFSRSSSNRSTKYDGTMDLKVVTRAWEHSIRAGVTPFVGLSYAVRPQFTLGVEGRLPILLTLSQTTSHSMQTYTSTTTGEVLDEIENKPPARYQYQLSLYGSSSNLLVWLGFRL